VTPDFENLRHVKTFKQLVAYLRKELDWPIETEDFDELTFEYAPEELGLESTTAAKIREIRQLRPLASNQPWGIFFVSFEPKRLPVLVLRRILSVLVLKKRHSANKAQQAAWRLHDLLFISSYGESDHRDITFAHFAEEKDTGDLPTLRVLGWDDEDTPLHVGYVDKELKAKLRWPEHQQDVESWRKQWSSAFTLRPREVITTSRALAERLAELAKSIRKRANAVLRIETERGTLRKLYAAFKQALIHDLNEDGFADMYAQTISYGLLTARVSRPSGLVADNLSDMVPITNPFLKELLETFLTIGGRKGKIDFDELGINEVVQLLRDADMEAVLRDFGDRNPQEDPVIHFYELFLKQYDAEKRIKRGVFYTPRPVVSFIVRSVDEILRVRFQLEDGLADTSTWNEVLSRNRHLRPPKGVRLDEAFVQLIDPAAGTGTFLVESIDLIHRTMMEKWKGQGCSEDQCERLWKEYVPKHLLPRLYGFELMMAPYAIAHMKVGLKLWETGYRFHSDQRSRVYLTNSLEPATDDRQEQFQDWIPALAHEAQAVNKIKRSQCFTVVIGNPPYAGHSANNQIKWIVDKVYDYKRGLPDLQKPGQAKWLQDDYVKFLRFAELLVGGSSAGVLGFITNHSFLNNPTFRGMRRSLLATFSELSFLDLHGNTKSKEAAPGGVQDGNVFDIQQGVAISVFTKASSHESIFYGSAWGTREAKYALLDKARMSDIETTSLKPSPEFYLFVPQDADLRSEYETGISLRDVMSGNGDPAPGIVTTQDEFAIAFSRKEIAENVEALLQTKNEAEARDLFRLCTQSQWNYRDAKRALSATEWKHDIKPILYRPFDDRWTVFNSYVAVHRRERVMRHMLAGDNLGLITARNVEIGRGFEHVFCAHGLIQHHTVSIKEVNYLFPLYLYPDQEGLAFGHDKKVSFAPSFLSKLAVCLNIKSLGSDGLPEGISAQHVFYYIYALLHSATYRKRYESFLRVDFPRVLMTHSLGLFRCLANLGASLVGLHTMESSFISKQIGIYFGVERPEIGKIEYKEETVWLDRKQASGFRSVPQPVWDFHIGGYQVCEKWLKDRKDRKLSKLEIEYYQKVVVALSETIRIMSEIDKVIDAHGGWPGAFLTGEKASGQSASS
jgi:predicted helicase